MEEAHSCKNACTSLPNAKHHFPEDIILKLQAYAILHNDTETTMKPREINIEFISNYPVISSPTQN
jgi:hypothetical protein